MRQTMSDLIERDKVIETVYQLRKKPADDEWKAWVERLNAIPSARPKDEWIARRPSEKGLGVVYECPLCEYEVDCVPTNFCPNCGADMRERKDFQVIVNGNCTKCGKPLSGNRIFICEECEEQSKESE